MPFLRKRFNNNYGKSILKINQEKNIFAMNENEGAGLSLKTGN